MIKANKLGFTENLLRNNWIKWENSQENVKQIQCYIRCYNIIFYRGRMSMTKKSYKNFMDI